MLRTIDNSNAEKWCADAGLLLSDGRVSLAGPTVSAIYRIPADSGKKTALARAIAALFAGEGESMLWITEHGIWPSSEDRGLFDGFRKSIGELKPLRERPGHVFSAEDLGTAVSLIAMVLYFVWGATVVSAQTGVLVRISHDEILEVHLRTGDDVLAKKADVIGRIVARTPVGRGAS